MDSDKSILQSYWTLSFVLEHISVKFKQRTKSVTDAWHVVDPDFSQSNLRCATMHESRQGRHSVCLIYRRVPWHLSHNSWCNNIIFTPRGLNLFYPPTDFQKYIFSTFTAHNNFFEPLTDLCSIYDHRSCNRYRIRQPYYSKSKGPPTTTPVCRFRFRERRQGLD